MEKTRSGLRRRSERLQNNDARGATTPAPLIQRQPRTSVPSEKRRRSAPKARPKRSKDQTTLTQIDFVTRMNPTPDLDLDFIEHGVPSPPRKSRNTGNAKKAKIDRKQSNTLTQMDYVTRRPWDNDEEELGEDMPHVPGTDDEDDDYLERTGTPPRWEAVQNENNLEPAHNPSPERRAKRRRLESIAPVSPTSYRSEIGKSQPGRKKETEGHKPVSNPNQPATGSAPSLHPDSQGGTVLHATPKKQQKWEIPSSQSPDSPGFIMLDNPPRSPLKAKSLNSPLAPVSRKPGQTPSSAKVAAWSSEHSKQHPKGVMSGSPITVDSQYTPRTLGTEDETPGTSPMPAALGEAQKDDCSRPLSPMGTKPTSQEKPCSSEGVYTPKDINVPKVSKDREVCETDAESEDELHDSHPPLSKKDPLPHLTDLDDTHGEVDSGNTCSLPGYLDSHPNPDEADAIPNHSTALTDASLLYYRRPQDTLGDPTASELDIDSERLAELFPQNEQETIGSTLPAWSVPDSTPRQHPPTQNPPDISTEFIPESSQSPADGETHDVPNSSPPEVILVESSQSNDQPTQGEKRDSVAESKGIFTTSQLLPDSLMESMPGPPSEWMFSDDFILE